MALGGDYSEKRDFIRMEVDCDVEYREGDGAFEHGRGRNLSASGVAFEADRVIPEGTLIEVRVLPRKSVTPPLHAEVEVVRVLAGEEGGHYIACETRRILD